MFCRFAISFTLLFSFGFGTPVALAQEVLEQIVAAGGSVAPISAQDKTLEVTFNLSEKPITDEQLKPLAGVPKLVWLNLANTKITDAGLQHIAKLPLEKLHLEKTAISDEGLKWLKDCQKLEYLNLYGTQVTDAGLQSLTGLKSLKKVYLWQSKVTPNGMDELRKKMPQLKVVGAVTLKSEVKESGAPQTTEAAPKANAAEKKPTANDQKSTEAKSKTDSTDPPKQEKSSRRKPDEESKKKKKDDSSAS